MYKEKLDILVIEDDEDDFILTKALLAEADSFEFKVEWASNYDDGLNKICEFRHDIYLIDFRLGPKTGVDLIKEAISKECSNPMILLTGQDSKETDNEAMNQGAADYLIKGALQSQLLERSIRYALSRYKTLKQLHDKEVKYRNLFEKSVDAIFVTDPENQFEEINEAMVQLFGYNKAHLLYNKIDVLFKNDKDISIYQKALEEKKQIRGYEVIMKCQDGHELICEITSNALLDTEGNITGYQGIIHDISDRKKAENELLVAEKLSMTGKLVRTIAHEVRNPLTNISLSLEQLKEELTDNEESALYTDIIDRNTTRINQLITELLDSSRPKELKLEEAILNDILEDSLKYTYDRIHLRGLKLEKQFEETPPAMFDRENLKIALLNIILNAVEAVEDDIGKLTIITGSDKDNVFVSIADNGVGISPENIKKLFDPFFSEKNDGMGLGLTSARNIISSHSGKIEVQSEPGKGTRFLILFPIHQNSTEGPPLYHKTKS